MNWTGGMDNLQASSLVYTPPPSFVGWFASTSLILSVRHSIAPPPQLILWSFGSSPDPFVSFRCLGDQLGFLSAHRASQIFLLVKHAPSFSKLFCSKAKRDRLSDSELVARHAPAASPFSVRLNSNCFFFKLIVSWSLETGTTFPPPTAV